MKVKIFMDAAPDELEQKVNAWLESEPLAEIVHITTHFDSTFRVTEGGSTFWDGLSYLTVVYRMRE